MFYCCYHFIIDFSLFPDTPSHRSCYTITVVGGCFFSLFSPTRTRVRAFLFLLSFLHFSGPETLQHRTLTFLSPNRQPSPQRCRFYFFQLSRMHARICTEYSYFPHIFPLRLCYNKTNSWGAFFSSFFSHPGCVTSAQGHVFSLYRGLEASIFQSNMQREERQQRLPLAAVFRFFLSFTKYLSELDIFLGRFSIILDFFARKLC